ncbi:hypothetical protein ISCGN_018381 [Ixodes scapularis]
MVRISHMERSHFYIFMWLLLRPAFAWENTHLFQDLCLPNASRILHLGERESSAVVGLAYPLSQAHDCTLTVTSHNKAIIVVVRLLNLKRTDAGCEDYVKFERGPGEPFLFDRPRCQLFKNDTAFGLVEGPVTVRFTVTPPVHRRYTGLNIAFTTYYKGDACNSDKLFMCSAKSVCISKEWTCNGINNCGDNSDEPRHLSAEPCQLSPDYFWGPLVFSIILLAFSSILIYVVVFDIYKARLNFGNRNDSLASSALLQTHEEDIVASA